MTDQLKRAISAAKTAQTNAEATSIASSSAGDQTFDMSESSYKTSHTAVRKARRFAMQGLYEWLVTDRRFDTTGKLGWKANAPHDIAARTRATNAMHTVHIGYYHEMMHDIPEQVESLDALIAQHLDREIDKLDTVEHAILLIGAYELQNRLEIPYKVVLDEAMKLNNHFGATDAHKLINAVLDRMAIELRAIEVDADIKANLRTSQKVATPSTSKQPDAKQTDSNENVADADSNTDSKPTASTKPRISANNATVKRNSASKASANISEFKASKQNDAAKNVVIPETAASDNTVADNNITDDAVSVNPNDDQNILESTSATVESTSATDSIDSNHSDSDDVVLDSNEIDNNEIDSTAVDSTDKSRTDLDDTDLNNTPPTSND